MKGFLQLFPKKNINVQNLIKEKLIWCYFDFQKLKKIMSKATRRNVQKQKKLN